MSDTQQGAVHREQGGDLLTVASGGSINVESGGSIVLESGASLTVNEGALSAVPIFTGSYTAVADDATADAATIDTGLDSVGGFIVQIYRSDVIVTADADISEADGVITVADGAATYAVTAGDVINVIAWT